MPTRRRSPLFPLAALTIAATLLAGPGDATEPGEHDFGTSVVVFTLEYEDDLLPPPPWALAEARIRRLGNVFFLTGIEPEPRSGAATRHWIPLADVVRLAEYDDVESAREALEEETDEGEGARSVVRPVGRRGGG